MHRLKIGRVGDSAGFTLPERALARLRVVLGDHVCLVETKDGFLVTRCDESLDEGLAAFGKSRDRYRNALKKLSE